MRAKIIALLLICATLLSACAEMVQKQRAVETDRRQRLQEAAEKAKFTCTSKKQCDKAFTLAQVFVEQNSDMKIQLVSNTLIQTYSPVRSGTIGITVRRIPNKGESESLELDAWCDGMWYVDHCNRIWGIFGDFKPFIDSRL